MDYRYWDSVTFLGWLGDEADKVAAARRRYRRTR